MLQSVGGSNVFAAFADSDHQLNFVVQISAQAGVGQGAHFTVVDSQHGIGRLHKEKRWFTASKAHLFGVLGIVATDAVNAVDWKTLHQSNDRNAGGCRRRKYVAHTALSIGLLAIFCKLPVCHAVYAAPYTAAMHLDITPNGLRPDWPAPAHIHALCTTRAGGVSAAPFDSLNIGDHVGDLPAAVHANRQILQAALHAITPGTQPVFLQQVHGSEVVDLRAKDHSKVPVGATAPCADAAATSAAHLACTIMVADCLPVLLTNRQGSAVAAAHAGWRGLAGSSKGVGTGVLEKVFERFMALAQSNQALSAIKSGVKNAAEETLVAADTLVWLGPCIGPQAFEVGAEVRAAFCAHDGAAAAHFVPSSAGKYFADLAALARQRLRALGVTHIYGNDSSAAWCTVGNPSHFFSHRRDSAILGASGRFAVCIWRS